MSDFEDISYWESCSVEFKIFVILSMKIVSHYFDITDWFFQSIQSLLQKQKIVTIALPGGHSLDGWYTSVI